MHSLWGKNKSCSTCTLLNQHENAGFLIHFVAQTLQIVLCILACLLALYKVDRQGKDQLTGLVWLHHGVYPMLRLAGHSSEDKVQRQLTNHWVTSCYSLHGLQL